MMLWTRLRATKCIEMTPIRLYHYQELANSLFLISYYCRGDGTAIRLTDGNWSTSFGTFERGIPNSLWSYAFGAIGNFTGHETIGTTFGNTQVIASPGRVVGLTSQANTSGIVCDVPRLQGINHKWMIRY